MPAHDGVVTSATVVASSVVSATVVTSVGALETLATRTNIKPQMRFMSAGVGELGGRSWVGSELKGRKVFFSVQNFAAGGGGDAEREGHSSTYTARF